MTSVQKRYFLFVAILLTGCLQELPYNTDLKEQNLVVDARINNLNENQVVKLSRTLAYGVPPQAVTGAQITLYENKMARNLFQEKLDGQYEIEGNDYNPVEGASYFLKIELPGGAVYESEPEILLSPIKPDSLVWRVGQKSVITNAGLLRYTTAAFLSVYTPLNNGKRDLFLKWDWRSDFQFTTLPECNPFRTTYTCYFSNTKVSRDLKIFSNKDEGQQYLADFEIGNESIDPEYQYFETHYYSVQQQRISERAYEYFRKLRLVSEQNGSIFDAIPAYVQGNIHNVNNKNERVLGYVMITSTEIIRLKLNGAEVKKQYPLPSKEYNLCGWLTGAPGSQYFGGCCNCFEFPEPLIEKPDWW